MKLIPFISFTDGNAEAALNFYKEALNGKITMLTRYADSPKEVNEADKNKIIYGRLVFGDNEIMVLDDLKGETIQVNGNVEFYVEIAGIEELKVVFEKMSEGGIVDMPLGLQFWGSMFGLVQDKFGVRWRLNSEVA